MDLEMKLLDEARQRRDRARRHVLDLRAELEQAETEYHALDDALATLEGIQREHEDLARDLLRQR